jgi:hypothetical protein
MGNPNESRIRGKALEGSEQKDAVDHTDYEKTRDPDTEIRVDDEKDTLYDDGLDVEDDSLTLADTRGNRNPG